MRINELCELMGKTREEMEQLLKNEEVIELKLTEK